MPLFKAKQTTPADTTARDHLASAPPGARAEVLAGACVLATTGLSVAKPKEFGSPVTSLQLAEVENLVQRLLYQDDDFAAAVARKIALNLSAIASYSRSRSTSKWVDTWLGANGVKQGEQSPVEIMNDQDDPDGSGQNLADLFWMTFRAVLLGQSDAPVEWRFYSSLYTDPERHGLSYSMVAWGALALARLLNTGELGRTVPGLGEDHRTIPRLTDPGWYPLPTKARKLPNGDALVKCYWDGARWTNRCRVWSNGRFHDAIHSPHDAPTD